MKTTLAIMFAAIAVSAPAVNHAHTDAYNGTAVNRYNPQGDPIYHPPQWDYSQPAPVLRDGSDNDEEQPFEAHAHQPKAGMHGKPAADAL